MSSASGRVVRGYSGSIEVRDGELVLHRDCVPAKVLGVSGPPRVLPLAAVTSVKFRPATRLLSGVLSLGLYGQDAAEPRPRDAGGKKDCIVFQKKDNTPFETMYQWLKDVAWHNATYGTDPV